MRKTYRTIILVSLALAVVSCSGGPQAGRAGHSHNRGTLLGVAGDEEDVAGRERVVTAGEEARVAGGMTTVEDLVNEDIAQPAARVSDPLEPLNRVIYRFNDGLYGYVFEPVSRGYGAVVPDPVERGIGNFFHNLRLPKRFVGNVLQGKFGGAARETGKFLVNTTVGVLGFVRASDRFPALATPPEDLGQAMGRWHIGSGPYLVLPVLGPNTVRDAVGMVGDGFLDPLVYVGSMEYRLGARALEEVNALPGALADYNTLKAASIDPYLALRDAYLQARQQMVNR